MSEGIMEDILNECADRHIYLSDIYSPFFVSSYALHRFNVINQDAKIYWENKMIPNMRIHLLFTAPAGFMKSHYLTSFAGPENSIFCNTNTQIVSKQSMTEASFVGSNSSSNGFNNEMEGIAKTCKNGIVAVDEFSAVLNALKAQYNNQFEAQLLAALDHGNMHKDLASGPIDYKTCLTLWGGIQPARFDMTSGLGRRFTYMLFIPDQKDTATLRQLRRDTRNMKSDPIAAMKLRNTITRFNDDMRRIKTLTFDPEIDDFYDSNNFIHYETSLFDRIILGYNLATKNPDREFSVTLDDKKLIEMIEREKEWRVELQKGVDFAMIAKIMRKYDGRIHMTQLVDECMIYGWNAAQIGNIVKTMRDNALIKGIGKTIELVE